MARKLKRSASTPTSGAMGQISEKVASIAASLSEQPTAKQVMDSAQQIWLAGLGAFSKAQNEGRKVFDNLVKQGEQIEKHTRTVAEATIETAKEQASKTIGMASGKFDKLEQVFEDRVHKSLNRLGVLTSKDVEALSMQVADLSASVNALLGKSKAAAKPVVAKTRAASKPVAKKPVAKKPVATKPIAKKPVAKKPAATKSAR
jgi:poly(hydroxyalkanoate) granule-associated protein